MRPHSESLVHIVDDDAETRNYVYQLLMSRSIPARAYGSAEAFLLAWGSDARGCIVLDLSMPGMSGLDLLQRLRAIGSAIPVLMVSGHADMTSAVCAMKLGAVDVLPKPVEPAILVERIRDALRRDVQVHGRQEETDSMRERFCRLTVRERELLQLVVDGQSNKQIAARLDISIKTVANHRANLMAKTGALNAADLARLSTMAGIGQGQSGRGQSSDSATSTSS